MAQLYSLPATRPAHAAPPALPAQYILGYWGSANDPLSRVSVGAIEDIYAPYFPE